MSHRAPDRGGSRAVYHVAMSAARDDLPLGASDRIELVATIIMAAAAILTAWAAFQSAKWSGIQAIEFSRGNAARIESTRLDTAAGQQASIDVDVFLAWVGAVAEERQAEGVSPEPGEIYRPTEGTLSAFYFERMRPEFRPALEAWIETDPLVDEDAPRTPFEMDQYVLAAAVEAQQKLTEAGEHTDAALTANQNSDNHVLMAVALALAIFFAGVSSKLAAVRNRQFAILLSAVIFLGAGTVLAFLPKVTPF
jgi:hypothetical protein